MPTAISPISLKASSRLKLLSRLPQKSGRRRKPTSQRMTTKITAAASRRASSRTIHAPSVSRRVQAAQAGDSPRNDTPADHPRLDEHGGHQDDAEERRHLARRQLRHRLDFHFLTADVDDARDRDALAQHLVDQHDQDGAEAGADDTAAATEDAGAADDDGGDDDELVANAVLAVHALVLGHVHEAGERRAKRRYD